MNQKLFINQIFPNYCFFIFTTHLWSLASQPFQIWVWPPILVQLAHLSLSLAQLVFASAENVEHFLLAGIFTREFVGKRGDGGNCRGGVMRGSRLSRPLTSNASKFLLLLGISPLLHFPFLLDFVWAVCASSVLWRV